MYFSGQYTEDITGVISDVMAVSQNDGKEADLVHVSVVYPPPAQTVSHSARWGVGIRSQGCYTPPCISHERHHSCTTVSKQMLLLL